MTQPKFFAAVLVSGLLSWCAPQATGQTILFADNFNRANNTSLSADSTGMSGTLGNLGYLESWEGSPCWMTIPELEGRLLKSQLPTLELMKKISAESQPEHS